MPQPIECVGIVCFKDNQVLLIERGKQPRQGQWSIPGGRIEPKETEINACHRELEEETSVKADIISKIEVIDADFGNGPYRLHDYVARWQSGHPIAGDDAAKAELVDISRIRDMGMWSETVRIIEKAHDIFCEHERFNQNKI